jgi:hypothetical protein
MILAKAPPILSRIIMVVSALVLVGAVFIFVSRTLEPADIIPVTPPKKAEVFNPKADVSKHPAFRDLESDYMDPVPDMPVGRENPFNSVVAPMGSVGAEGVAVPRSQLRIVPVGSATGTVVSGSTSTTPSASL